MMFLYVKSNDFLFYNKFFYSQNKAKIKLCLERILNFLTLSIFLNSFIKTKNIYFVF